MKLWLGGITNSLSVIDLINQSLPFFDGLIFTLDANSRVELVDRFDEIVSENKKFNYLLRQFSQAHDWRANDWLYSGFIKQGDYVCIMDSTDRFKQCALDNINQLTNDWNKSNINSIYLNRPFIFKFTGHQYFDFSPHWTIKNLLGQSISFKMEDFIINTRNINSMGIEHPIKYFIEYKRSNQTQLLYQQYGNDIWQRHENIRVNFQIYVEKELGFECNVVNLIDFISKGIKNKDLPEQVIEFIELEVNMQDLVRYYILKQDLLSEIAMNRFNWSFKKFYYNGIEHQNKDDGFVGIFNQYRMKNNLSME